MEGIEEEIEGSKGRRKRGMDHRLLHLLDETWK